jgi:hypothetical protein
MNIYRRGDEISPSRECFQFGVRDDGGFHTGNELGQGIDADGLTAGGEGCDECGGTTGVGSSMRSLGFVKAWAARTVEALWKRSILNSSFPRRSL